MYLTDFIRKYQQKPKIYPIDFFCAKDYETNDTMDNIDRETLKAVGQTVLQVVYNH
jgi:hypothetical protein